MTPRIQFWSDACIRQPIVAGAILAVCFAASELLRAEKPAAQPPVAISPLAEVRTWRGSPAQRVVVRGVLTRDGKEAFLQDATAGLLVRFASRPHFRLGDEVEAVGIPSVTDYGAELASAEGHVLWVGAPPPPIDVHAGQAARGDFDNEFIELTATLKSVERLGDKAVQLTAIADGQQFIAILEDERREIPLPKLQRMSMVRLRGICSMAPYFTQNGVPFVVLLRSGADVEQLAGPPWWTPSLLLRDGLLLLSAALGAWIFRMRFRSARQREIQKEREHIAHELHDTLAQSFAGVAFQLQAVRSDLPEGKPQLKEHVELALNMVRYSHQEARRSIAALRENPTEAHTLLKQIDESIRKMVGTVPIDVQVASEGEPVPLPLRVSNAILRVAQESTANALNHSQATKLNLRLRYLGDTFELEVRDDGTGFDPSNKAHQSGFGVKGMLLRMRKIGGNLVVDSTSRGTAVFARAPLTGKIRNRFWKGSGDV